MASVVSLDIAALKREVIRFLRVLEAAQDAGVTVGGPPQLPPRDIQRAYARLAAGASPGELGAERESAFHQTLLKLAREAAALGLPALRQYYRALSKDERALIEKVVLEELVPLAKAKEAS
jgi:hypothetical protein